MAHSPKGRGAFQKLFTLLACSLKQPEGLVTPKSPTEGNRLHASGCSAINLLSRVLVYFVSWDRNGALSDSIVNLRQLPITNLMKLVCETPVG